MNLAEACCFLQKISQVPITVFSEDKKMNAFCTEYQLHDAQEHLSPRRLQSILDHVGSQEILCIVDIFGIHTIFFQSDTQWVAFGPFCVDIYSRADCKMVLNRFDVPRVSVEDLAWFRSQFPVVPLKQAVHYVRCFISQLEPNAQQRNVRTIQFDAKQLSEDGLQPVQRKTYGALVNERYQVELHMMANIRSGQADAAVEDWRILHREIDFIKKIGNTLEIARISAAITRTTIRLAAMEAGLPAEMLDRRTGESREIVANASDLDVIDEELERLIRDICRAIQKKRDGHYSSIVLSTVYYIERKYNESISITEIAKQLEISVNHLISQFRKETGLTPNAYLENLRMKHAKRLLVGTNLPIQEISAKVGIMDSNYFTKVFKKHNGITPVQYRKKQRGEEKSKSDR